MHHLNQLPEAKQLIEKSLIDIDFFKRVGDDLIDVYLEEA